MEGRRPARETWPPLAALERKKRHHRPVKFSAFGVSSMVYDIAIIGGGIIGMAAAMALSRRPKISLAVLEAEDRLAAHQTGHNSGVIHSGLYYKPGSLKARNCTEGREAMYRFCQDHGIAHEQCGKLVVATSKEEIPALNELERRGRANGIQGMKRLGREELGEYEPHAAGMEGLWVPVTGIVDYVQVTEKYAEIVQNSGGEVHTGTRVTGSKREPNGIILETNRGEVNCRNLINCGGLQSDRIARMTGIDPKLRITPFRGEYHELIPERRHLVKNLIYPVPDPAFPFLGVHFTRLINGGIEAGPNAVLAFRREGYTKSSFSLRDTREILFYRGFWVLAFKYWKTGFGEIFRSWSKGAFVKALRKLMPELRKEDIRPAGAGVRAQALESSGSLVDDFRIVEADRMIHVLNSPSPAATASISIGETISHMAERNFNLS
jgi:L-2-hydroxyglutarate oxidase